MDSGDEEYEYEYSDEEGYVIDDDDDAMEWNPMASGGSENPNAAPTIAGTCISYRSVRVITSTTHHSSLDSLERYSIWNPHAACRRSLSGNEA